MSAWGTGAFENECARDWFRLVEEAVDPGDVIAAALDEALAEPDELGLEAAWAAIAAAELSASCAGVPAEELPDPIRRWAGENPHEPYAGETAQAIDAVARVRDDSALREQWDEESDSDNPWLRVVDDLLARLRRSATEGPEIRP